MIAFLSITINVNAQWEQIGSDLDGTAQADVFGSQVRISEDGNTLAVSARYNDEFAQDAGQVKVYGFDGSNWVQKGGNINGEAEDDASGISLDISADGNVVAIGSEANAGNGSAAGHVRVFEYTGSDWVQKGNDIDGEAAGDWCGISLDLTPDGNTIIVGSSLNNGNGGASGHSRIFVYSAGDWIQLGQDIEGEMNNDNSGYKVRINNIGNRVAISYPLGESVDRGAVRVFDWDGNAWNQIGNTIIGEDQDDRAGRSLSFNEDGDIIAVGTERNDGGGFSRGHVRVFQLNGNNWFQMGDDLDGTNDQDGFGYASSLNAAGDIIAVGATRANAGPPDSGYVNVYRWTNNNWQQVGETISGSEVPDWFGWSLHLNRSGSTLAISGPVANDGTGVVRVYSNNLLSAEDIFSNSFNIFPNPVNNILNISFKEPRSNVKITISNVIGQHIKSIEFDEIQNARIDFPYTENIFLLTVDDGQNISTIKLLKN